MGTFIVIAVLAVIVVSLGSGMFYLVKDRDDSTRTVKALTIRITLSLLLIGLLFVLYALGLIHPHGIYPTR
ncbi:MAG TPA: twin transmembrane helix small protein [Gammaproteobacteria bacterium]|nr:twin transmembrane helix small protein [Gammaproteobacteria bacterium]